MSDPNLTLKWAQIEEWLKAARSHLRVKEDFQTLEILTRYQDFLSHNELELAMNSLHEVGEHQPQGYRFWDSLCQAAMHLGLESDVECFATLCMQAKGNSGR